MGTDFSGCTTAQWGLYRNNKNAFGTVEVWNDAYKLYIKVTFTDTTARFTKLVFWAGTTWDPDGVTGACRPQLNEQGGMWDYSTNASGSASHSYTIERTWTDVGVDADALCNLDPEDQLPLHVVIYAENDKNQAGFGGEQTGSSTGCNKQGNGPWWYYGDYTICCGVIPVAGSWSCGEGAYAFGTHILAAVDLNPKTGRPKNNPDNLPSLGLENSSWGWAIEMIAPNHEADLVEQSYPLYMGAGQLDRDKGAVVGSVHIVWDGTNVTVRYTVNQGYALGELHLYAGDAEPATTAPGQWGRSFTPDAGSISYTFPTFALADTGSDGVWFIAKAELCQWVSE
ncbi:hypothetical protein [Ottowia sp.]|uniref:hypothetical protein n=1 Tax=Ottowia sp. TaxID=1898956 RepID=UPI002C898694|nr:hypothetical protein [Ottowia sp.]HRN76129.1 hypothetical protein [Ottowia sp.]HRQ03457.1 hypothetical protein [Ottowia sp.]